MKSAAKVYVHPRCSTCKNAIKFLDKNKIKYELENICETPPSEKELRTMLKLSGGEVKKLFNTSGLQYKELQLKDRLPKLSESEAIKLLAKNGMLVRRPFVVGPEVGLVGFREAQWLEQLRRAKLT